MTTEKFLEDVAAILNVVMPKAEARAKAKGRVLAATERSEVARLVRESVSGNAEALEALKVWVGTPASPAKAAAAAVNEETDLGRALMESGRRSTAPSPFFSESVARTVKEITEDAGIAGATPGVSDEIGRMPLVNGDERFHELTRSWASQVSFGGQKLG